MNEIKAKSISKAFKFVTALGITVCSILKWFNIFPNATMNEICMVWVVIYGLGAGTIDLNIIFDKFIKR